MKLDATWTRQNLASLVGLCAAAAAALAGHAMAGRMNVGDRPAVFPDRLAAAAERVNPNAADEASLRRLPGLEQVRAAAVVDYRRAHGPAAFRSAQDLTRVSGIGPGTVALIEEYLEFPGDPG